MKLNETNDNAWESIERIEDHWKSTKSAIASNHQWELMAINGINGNKSTQTQINAIKYNSMKTDDNQCTPITHNGNMLKSLKIKNNKRKSDNNHWTPILISEIHLEAIITIEHRCGPLTINEASDSYLESVDTYSMQWTWTSMSMGENRLTSMKINELQWTAMITIENHWRSMKPQQINEDQYQPMRADGPMKEPMELSGNQEQTRLESMKNNTNKRCNNMKPLNTSLIIIEAQWSPMKTNNNQFESIRIAGNICELISMRLIGKLWASMKIKRNQWKLMKISDNQWNSMRLNENLRKPIQINDHEWK